MKYVLFLKKSTSFNFLVGITLKIKLRISLRMNTLYKSQQSE